MTTTSKASHDDASTSAVCAAALGVVFTLAALGVAGGRVAFSVAVGAAIAIANLVMMRAIVKALIQPPAHADADAHADAHADADADNPDHKAEGRRGGAAWGGFALIKILLLFGGIFLLLTKNLVDPIPLVVGYGVLPLGIAGSTVVSSLRPRRRL